MSGPVVKAVRSAIKCQEIADREGEKRVDFECNWACLNMAHDMPHKHYTARLADEQACGPKEQARRDAESFKRRAMPPTWQMAFA